MPLTQYIGIDEALTRLLHTRVCSKCRADRGREAGAADVVDSDQRLHCQARCPIFQVLPTLQKYLENPDSLAGSLDGVVEAVSAFCPACNSDRSWRAEHPAGCKPGCPLRLYRHEMAGVLDEVARRLNKC